MANIYEYSVPFDGESGELPIEIKYNFDSLIDKIKTNIDNNNLSASKEYRSKIEAIEAKGVLNKPFSDINILEENIDDLSTLLESVFPPLLVDNEIKAAILPFSKFFIHPTKRFEKILDNAGSKENIEFKVESNSDPYVGAALLILNFLYRANINFANHYYFDVTDNGITKHYRSLINADFAKMIRKEDTPELTAADIEELKNNINDKALWMEKIPPNSYVFEGFAIINLLDTTRQYQESELKDLLLKSNVLDNPGSITQLKSLFRSYFQVPDLEIGLVAYDNDADRTKPMGFGLWQSILLKDDEESCSIQQLGPELIESLKNKSTELIINIDELLEEKCDVSKKLASKNVGSYALFPLTKDGRLVALLEMMSKEKGKINKITGKNFENIKDLFATAVNRYLEEYEVKLEAIIQEKCTAIHSTVEWRFKQAADVYYRNQLSGTPSDLNDIDFPEVFPLYGQIDIKDSSLKRNTAIKDDLLEQLNALKELINAAYIHSNLPYYGQVAFKIETLIRELGLGISVGDEVTIVDFIKREVEPNFEQLSAFNGEMAEELAKYKKKVGNKTQVINSRRKQYEKSVNKVTKTITKMMSERQHKAQEMFPHYYEKYKTDGVEHNIYIGGSLVKSKKYFPMYLKNLRLWQLMSMVEIENKLHLEHDTLEVPLKVCSLVLVHSNAITIRFRMDEKKFDVEGAYNIRYEIIKKRIDKSLIQKTKERLTQPGKLAIVFAQSTEEREYKSYLEYLESIGYIKPGIEVVDLSPVQGINGLRALRAEINYDKDIALDSSIRVLEASMN